MTQRFEKEVIVQREVFYDAEKMFGIYAVDTVEYNLEISKNKYGNFSIQGTTRRLAQGEKYNMIFEGTYSHAKYGDFYKIVEVKFDELTSASAQDRFLREILSNTHYNALKRAYPDEKLVDFILEGKVDTKKTKGIKAPTLIKIIGKIKANMKLAELIAFMGELDISPNKLEKILMHFNNDPYEAITIMQENIYQLCDIKSFGFKTVDEIALKRGDDPENNNRIEACIKHVLATDTSDGHTWSFRSQLLEQCHELLNLPMSLISATLNGMSEIEVFQTESQVALRRNFNTESNILLHLNRITEEYKSPSIDGIEYNLRQTELAQGFEFTDEQRNAIIEGSQYGVMILNGLAGSGKSATVRGLIESLQIDNYMTCALSGKAVSVLSQREIKASTIHRMLGFNPEGGFLHKEDNPLEYDLVVIDETSMVNISLFHSVIRAVKNGAKLIIVGDSGQLPAIGCGDVLRDLLETKLFPCFELTQVHRQAAKSGILSLANSIRKGNQVFPYNSATTETFGELQDQTVISYSNKEAIVGDLLGIATAYSERVKNPQDLYDFQVIVANKERGNLSVKSLNNQLQTIFNDMSKPSLNRGGYEYREGDKIITQGNAYKKHKYDTVQEYYDVQDMLDYMEDFEAEATLKQREFDFYNGTMGYIEKIDTKLKIVFICLEGVNGLVVLKDSELDKIEMAYAATVHKLQGSSIPNVIVAIDFGAFKLLSKQLIYTAFTRTSQKGVALVENNALHSAIDNDASGNRRTFLRDFIKEQLKVNS